jgi:hypothetical protein
MSLDGDSILASLLVSGIGFVVFAYGRKQVRYPQILAGLALLVFPYFVPSVVPMFAIALAILVALWGAVRWGF